MELVTRFEGGIAKCTPVPSQIRGGACVEHLSFEVEEVKLMGFSAGKLNKPAILQASSSAALISALTTTFVMEAPNNNRKRTPKLH
jgi:hypothetical protein